MPEDKIDKNQMLFLGLVQSLTANAWIQLGKQKSPITDKIERNLNEASFTIDMLEMLQEKTKGNLNSDESRILEKTISDLKMNYVDEKLKESKEPKKEPKEKKEADKKEEEKKE
ncbi:MAG: DUF1844 domain-containing protein, partial [Candidatus Neomarinimicrobiota bacterium]